MRLIWALWAGGDTYREVVRGECQRGCVYGVVGGGLGGGG